MTTTAHPTTLFERAARQDIELGSFAPAATPTLDAPAPSKIVVVTYNIRYAVGSFLITGSLLRRIGVGRPARRPALIAGNISKAARVLADGRRMPPADIIALQEADRETVRAGGRHVARELARELRMHYARAGNAVPAGEEQKSKQWYLDFEELIGAHETGDTGVAFLSRLPVAEVERLELPWSDCAWRPRLALAATFRLDGRNLHLFNAHIDPHTGTEGQLAQHEAILKSAREMSAGQPSVLLGDYNTLRAEACIATRRLLESHGYTSPLPTGTPTWHAGLLRLHADWIFVRGARVTRWGVARGFGISDHWPVWVEIELDERTGDVES